MSPIRTKNRSRRHAGVSSSVPLKFVEQTIRALTLMLHETPPTLTGGGVSAPSLAPPSLPESEWGLYNRRTSDSRILMERGSQPGRPGTLRTRQTVRPPLFSSFSPRRTETLNQTSLRKITLLTCRERQVLSTVNAENKRLSRSRDTIKVQRKRDI